MSYENLLTDTCTIVRRTQGVFNTGTGQYGSPTDTSIYAGACRYQSGQGAGRIRVGEEAVIEERPRVFLPASATGPKPEDILTITASRDSIIVNREMTVREVMSDHAPNSPLLVRSLVLEEIEEGP